MNAFINLVILFLHIIAIGGFTLIALRIGKEAMIAWLSFLAIGANIFVLKQMTVLGLNVTCSDSLAVGMILGTNLMQEYFGKKTAQRTIWISFFITLAYLVLTQFHLSYRPNHFDTTQRHFEVLLSPLPRIITASLVTFLIVQLLDVLFFSFLRKKTSGRYLLPRVLLSLVLSQTFDTVLFSWLGLYGLADSIGSIIIFSLLIKILVIFISSPFIVFSKKIIGTHAPISI